MTDLNTSTAGWSCTCSRCTDDHIVADVLRMAVSIWWLEEKRRVAGRQPKPGTPDTIGGFIANIRDAIIQRKWYLAQDDPNTAHLPGHMRHTPCAGPPT